MRIMNKKRYNVSCETLFLPFKITLLTVLIAVMITPSMYAIETVSGLTTDNYLIIDKDSEMILAGSNYDEQKGIASITKVMSYYVYMDKISSEEVDLAETMIPISDEIVDNLAKDSALSGVYFNYDTQLPLDQMLDLMMVYSDNGATKAIGEYLFGTEEEAVKAMNAKAKELGMENTMYFNTSGLTMKDYKDAILEGTKASDYNYSTAREQLILAKALLSDYPQVLDIVGQSSIDYNGYKLANFNLMLPNLDYEYPGVVGLKTGSSIEAGYCFVGYYIDPETNKEYLSIVLNSENTMKRFNDTTYLYNWIGDTEMQTIMEQDSDLDLYVKGAVHNIYQVKTNAEYQVPQSKNFNLERQQFEYNSAYFDENNKLIKDIPEGEIIGSFVYTIAEDDIEENEFETLTSSENTIKIKVVATEEVKKEGFIGSIFTGLTDFFINVFESL